jgi:hypothetical protein
VGGDGREVGLSSKNIEFDIDMIKKLFVWMPLRI